MWEIQFPLLDTRNYDPFQARKDFSGYPLYQDTACESVLDGVPYRDRILTKMDEINTVTEQLLALIYVYPEFEDKLSDFDNFEGLKEQRSNVPEETISEAMVYEKYSSTKDERSVDDELMSSAIGCTLNEEIDCYDETKATFLENLSLIKSLYSDSSPLTQQVKIMQKQMEAISNSVQIILADVLKRVLEIGIKEGISQDEIKDLFLSKLSSISILYSDSLPLLDKLKGINADIAIARDTSTTLLKEIFHRVEKELVEEEEEEERSVGKAVAKEKQQEVLPEEHKGEEFFLLQEELEQYSGIFQPIIKDILAGNVLLIAELSANSSEIIEKLVSIREQTQTIRKAIQSVVDEIYDYLEFGITAEKGENSIVMKEIFLAEDFSTESVNYLAKLSAVRLQTLSSLKIIQTLIDELLGKVGAGYLARSDEADSEENDLMEKMRNLFMGYQFSNEMIRLQEKHLERKYLSKNMEKIMDDVLEEIDIIILNGNSKSHLDKFNELFMEDQLLITFRNYQARLNILKLETLSIWETMESVGDEYIQNEGEENHETEEGTIKTQLDENAKKAKQKELEICKKKIVKELELQQVEYNWWENALFNSLEGNTAKFTKLWQLIKKLLEELFDAGIVCEKEMLEIDDTFPDTLEELLDDSSNGIIKIPFVECLLKEFTEKKRQPGEILKKVIKCNKKWQKDIRNSKLEGYLPVLLEYLLNGLLFSKRKTKEKLPSENLRKHLHKNLSPAEVCSMKSIAKYLLAELLKYHILGTNRYSTLFVNNEDILSFAKCLLNIYRVNSDDLGEKVEKNYDEKTFENNGNHKEESEDAQDSSEQSQIQCEEEDEVTIMRSLIKCLTKYVDSNELIDEILENCLETPNFQLKKEKKSVRNLLNLFNDYITSFNKRTTVEKREQLKNYLYSILIDNVFKKPSIEKIVLGEERFEEKIPDGEETYEMMEGSIKESYYNEYSDHLFDEIYSSWLRILIEIQKELRHIHTILTTSEKPKSNWEIKMDIMITGETKIDLNSLEYFEKMAKMEEFLINLKEHINDLLLYLILYHSMANSSTEESYEAYPFEEVEEDVWIGKGEGKANISEGEITTGTTQRIHLLARLEDCKINLKKISSENIFSNKDRQIREESLNKDLENIANNLLKTNDTDTDSTSNHSNQIYHMFLFEAVIDSRIWKIKNSISKKSCHDNIERNQDVYSVEKMSFVKRRSHLSLTCQKDDGKENIEPCTENDNCLSSPKVGIVKSHGSRHGRREIFSDTSPATSTQPRRGVKNKALNSQNENNSGPEALWKQGSSLEERMSNYQKQVRKKNNKKFSGNETPDAGTKTMEKAIDKAKKKHSKRQFGSCDITNIGKKVLRTSDTRTYTNVNNNPQTGEQSRRAKYRRQDDQNNNTFRNSEATKPSSSTSGMVIPHSVESMLTSSTLLTSKDQLTSMANMGRMDLMVAFQNIIALNMAMDNAPNIDESLVFDEEKDQDNVSDTVAAEQDEKKEEKEEDPIELSFELTSLEPEELETLDEVIKEMSTKQIDSDYYDEAELHYDDAIDAKGEPLFLTPETGAWEVVDLSEQPSTDQELGEEEEEREKVVSFKTSERLESEPPEVEPKKGCPFSIPWKESSRHPGKLVCVQNACKTCCYPQMFVLV